MNLPGGTSTRNSVFVSVVVGECQGEESIHVGPTDPGRPLHYWCIMQAKLPEEKEVCLYKTVIIDFSGHLGAAETSIEHNIYGPSSFKLI